MNPQRLLRRMCVRHGVPNRDAARYLPLIEKALESPDDVRDRILFMVDGHLARQADGKPPCDTRELHRDLDEEVLIAVSNVLHNWTPSGKILEMGGNLPEFLPEDLDPDGKRAGPGNA